MGGTPACTRAERTVTPGAVPTSSDAAIRAAIEIIRTGSLAS